MESIMDTLKYTAIIHKSGGGTGFNFSKIRPEGDFVSSTSGAASGPLSFMRMFDTMTEVVKQGGIRRGANMGILNSNHPDIEKFIVSKSGNKGLRNFNISVLLMGDFWDCYNNDKPYPLVNPRNGEVVKTISAKMLFDKIVYQAWESAEPGVIFYDTVNKYNPFFESLGPIVTTNPCVTADTLIPTDNGLERIDSIKSDDIFVDVRTMENNSSQLVTIQNGVQKVRMLRSIKTGYKETLRLETNSGYELIATPDHKILTENGWKQLSDLADDDKILLQSGAGSFSKNSKLSFEVKNEIVGDNGRKYKLNLPTKWSKELGLILGWLTGDGWLNKKFNQIGLVFAEQDEDAKDILKPIFEGYCNREIRELEYENKCIQLRSSSKYVVDFFSKLGVKSIDKEVPNSLFTATEDAVAGFLQGLFSSDGTIGIGSKSRNYVRLNSSSKKLLKQVQVLLLNLGIRSSIYDRFTKPKKFAYTNKEGKEIEYKTSGINYELNISKDNVQRFLSKVGFLQSKHNDKIIELEKFEFYKEYFVDKIKSIENTGKREVWDITEPLTHSFIANGIVVHNCGEVLLYPNEPCNLGSINVWAFAKEDSSGNVYYDWKGLSETIHKAVRLLDNVIDINKLPLKEIEEMSLLTRKIGLGVMGIGDLLYEMRLAYDTDSGRKFIEKIMQFVEYHSKLSSIALA
ncbi:MAG: LAGLIDADG family homing endonuclease, partial [Nitrosopumilus sp.]